MKASFKFLGTGASMGVPVMGCRCEVCRSANPYNRRLRPSGLLMCKGKNFLFDAGPDLRTQALRYQIEHIDAVFLTHLHFDHIAGFDDLRAFYYQTQKPLLCVLSQDVLNELKIRFYYLFHEKKEETIVSPYFCFHLLKKEKGQCEIEKMIVQYMTYYHAEEKVTGYRIGSFAYITDIRTYDEMIFSNLAGIDVLILSVLRKETNKFHLGLDDAIVFANRVGAKKTYFTHLSHELDHDKTARSLPKGFFLAYDGLEIPVDLGKRL